MRIGAAALAAHCAPGALCVPGALRVPGALAQVLLTEPPKDLQGVDVVEKRGQSVPLDLPLLDSTGRAVRLGDYFDGKRPVLFLLAYYDCPMLCNLMLGDLQRAVQGQKWALGKDYRVVVLSFDHTNTLADAQVKRDIFARGVDLDAASKALVEAGFAPGSAQADPAPFLLTTEQNARLAADSVGFGYRLIEATGEYAHPSVTTLLTPAGSVSNYLYGRYASQYDAKQLRLAIADAAEGRLGSVFDRVMFWCYHYDPTRGAYTLQAMRVMQLGGAAIVVVVFGGVGYLLWTGRGRRRPASRVAPLSAGVMG